MSKKLILSKTAKYFSSKEISDQIEHYPEAIWQILTYVSNKRVKRLNLT